MILAGGPFGLGPLELVIILLVLVMLFGATRLADLGGSLGRGIKDFRKEIGSDDDPPVSPPSTSASASTIAPPPVIDVNGAENTVSAVKCASCGTLNPMGARHCSQCGTALTTAPVS